MDNAERVAGTFVDRISDFEFRWQGQAYRVGISIGIAPVGPGTVNANEPLSAADGACYAAKQLGGNRVSRGGQLSNQ